jgi:hypothetical protein
MFNSVHVRSVKVSSMMPNRTHFAFLFTAGALLASAQTLHTNIDLGGKDSPIVVVHYDDGDSKVTQRGGAFLVDFHPTLTLRNSSSKRIRSVTLLVEAQENSAGGKASVSIPSLDIAPGDTFPLRINQTLFGSPSVDVQLDGVLFEDLSFYGPDKLHLQYNMTVWELEARQDRKYYKNLLEVSGGQALQNAMIESLARQAEIAQPSVQMGRSRATVTEAGSDMQFAFLRLPEAPLELASGQAKVSATIADGPNFSVHNISRRPVRHLEIGWILRDQDGREFLAASLPADLNLAPGQSGEVMEDASLRLRGPGAIQSMKGFISSAEFADGSYWIPTRKQLDEPELRGVLAPSPEEQRLTSIYQKRGLNALIEELKKF